MVTIVTLMALASLGVDYGRVQAAKGQLRAAADAAARYAVMGISDNTYLAKAQAVASANYCDGTTISLTAADVTLGTWASGTFTAGGASPNAVKVAAVRTAARGTAIPLLFMTVLGGRSCDVHATSIATATSTGPTYAFVGLSSLNIGNSFTIDSYDSSNGAYSAATRTSNANLATNGNVNINAAHIYGNVYYKSGYVANGGGGPVAPDTAQIMTGTLSFANPTLPGSYTSMGNYNSPASGNGTLSAGNYYYQSFNLASGYTLHTNGSVGIYVGGNVSIAGTLTTSGNIPANLKIYTTQSAGVNISGNAPLYADIYAPNSPINFNSNGQFYGRIVGSQISISSSGGGWHFDEDLGPAATGSGGSGSISVTTVY